MFTLLGVALLTITHGWGLIVTAPLWLIVGSTSTATLSHRGQVNADQMAGAAAAGGGSAGSGGRVVTWKDLRIHARFPQGLPPGLDRMQLHERPRPVHPQRSKRAPGSITER